MVSECELCKTIGRIVLKFHNRQICQKCYDYFKLRKFYLQCVKCGRKIRNLKGYQQICSLCNKKNKLPLECKCTECGKISNSAHKRDGNPICHKCYLKEYKTPVEMCSECKEITHVFSRNPKILCRKCFMFYYKAPKHVCSVCEKNGPAHKKTKNGYICKKCYKKNYKPPKRNCTECGQFRSGCNTVSGKCPSCYNKERLKNDEKFLLRTRIRKRISKIFKRSGVSKKYPINYDKIAEFLGPCPGKREEYHIDHVFPLIAFDLTNKQHFLAAVAPENHQWLKVSDNCSKKDKFDIDLFHKYLNKWVTT